MGVERLRLVNTSSRIKHSWPCIRVSLHTDASLTQYVKISHIVTLSGGS